MEHHLTDEEISFKSGKHFKNKYPHGTQKFVEENECIMKEASRYPHKKL